MSSKISLWTGLIGCGVAISLLQPHIATAKSSVEIGRTAKAITVLITEPDSVGSGVILQKQGDIYTVITAAHVVKNQVNYQITTSDDRSYQVISNSIRRAPGNIDLAIIKFKSTANYPTAKLGSSNPLQSGMDLYVSGFPGMSKAITQSVFVFREGKVSANSNKIFDKGYSLVYSNDTLPGMSGGAVLNGDGELVAIHGRGDRDETGAKTGFNLGIPIDRFNTVASNMGVNLGRTVTSMPQSTAPKADDYIISAGQKLDKRDYQGSLADYNLAIKLKPNLAIAYNYRGFLKENKLQDLQGGLADYNRAIAIDPNLAIAYSSRGSLKSFRLQDIQGGLADYNRAIAIDPKFTIAYYNRALLRKKYLKDDRGSLADYNRAIQLDPNDVYAYTNRGNLKKDRLQDIQGALADYNLAIQLEPKLALPYNNRALVKEKLLDIQGALADYNLAIQLEPDLAITYYNRGSLRYKQNDRAGAIDDLKKAARLFQQQQNTVQYGWSIELLRQWQATSQTTDS